MKASPTTDENAVAVVDVITGLVIIETFITGVAAAARGHDEFPIVVIWRIMIAMVRRACMAAQKTLQQT